MKQIYSIIIISSSIALFLFLNQNIHSIILNNNTDYSNVSKSFLSKNEENLNVIPNSTISNSIIGNDFNKQNNLTGGNDTSHDVSEGPCKMPPCPLGKVCIQVCPDSLIS